MKYNISVNIENEIVINNKTLVVSNWKTSEIREILSQLELNTNGSLKTMINRLSNHIESELQQQEKEVIDSIDDSDMIVKSVNSHLQLQDYINQNSIPIGEFSFF